VRAILLFDLDGVIRDVSASYRRAIRATVQHFSGWSPEPAAIDDLKSEGCWNNDWDASLELLRRHRQGSQHASGWELPNLEQVAEVFSGFYFGGDPCGPPAFWKGFIREEPLLVGPDFFTDLSQAAIAWGFVSGAEPPSARFLLQERLGLRNPPLVAMGDAPDKPDPTGVLRLAERLAAHWGLALGPQAPPVAYVGDTVADVETVQRARQACPKQRFFALAVAPPHLHPPELVTQRKAYEQRLMDAGADHLLGTTAELQIQPLELITSLLAKAP
jgi:HAD superfamily phosphatase